MTVAGKADKVPSQAVIGNELTSMAQKTTTYGPADEYAQGKCGGTRASMHKTGSLSDSLVAFDKLTDRPADYFLINGRVVPSAATAFAESFFRA